MAIIKKAGAPRPKFAHCFHTKRMEMDKYPPATRHPCNTDMITIKVDESNPLTQEFYNNILCNLQFHRLTCPSCRHSACLYVHSYYKRCIKRAGSKFPVKICRVRCSFCNSTHALLPSSIVPYSQLPLCDHAAAAAAYLDSTPTSDILRKDNQLDYSSLRYSVRQFRRHWKQRILSFSLPLHDLNELISGCFINFFRQFMQNKSTVNILFINTT